MTRKPRRHRLEKITLAEVEGLFRSLVVKGSWNLPTPKAIEESAVLLEMLRDGTVRSQGAWATNDGLVAAAEGKLREAATAIQALSNFLEKEVEEYREHHEGVVHDAYVDKVLVRHDEAKTKPRSRSVKDRGRPDSAYDDVVRHAYHEYRVEKLKRDHETIIKVLRSNEVSHRAPWSTPEWRQLAHPLLKIFRGAMATTNAKSIAAKSADGPAARFILSAIQMILLDAPTGDDLRKFFAKRTGPGGVDGL